MDSANVTNLFFTGRRRPLREQLQWVAALVLTLLATGALTYQTGGIGGAYAHTLILPILLAAVAYGAFGGIVMALIAGFATGPYVPIHSAMGAGHLIEHWLVCLVVFVTLGGAGGALYDRLRRRALADHIGARLDHGTGLRNEIALRETLESMLLHRAGKKGQLAVVLMRATDLAEIVDVVGIQGSEKVMREIGQHLERIAPEARGVYRFGASQLALIVEVEDEQTLKRSARTLHDAAASSFNIEGAPVRIEPALGIGRTDTESPLPAEELLRRARMALRYAVAGEHDWISYQPTFEVNTRESMDLIARVEPALKAHEFELHYQPKIRLSDGQPVGVEGLARWRNPDGSLVPPGSFMPKLERTSLITEFSRFVVDAAIDFARTGLVTPVSLNLAARNLADDSIISGLLEGLKQTGTPGHFLEVELTESALMRDPETTIALLQRLRDHGVGVSIDDFGTGYASFSYLRRLPATNLKIDRSFVRPLEGDHKSRRLVLAMVEAGHSLDLSVTAEGVETVEQARILTDLGCDFGQGFLWSAARPADDLRQWLSERADRDLNEDARKHA